MKIFRNFNLPTPAKWSKIGMSCVGISTFIGGYGLTSNNSIVGYIGLGIGIVGTLIANLTGVKPT